jgi:ligand-binding SRPBCC domain-containing protein
MQKNPCLKAPEREFSCTQLIPRPLSEVFSFFSSEKNLEKITPPWLRFKVLRKSTPEMEPGTLIDYHLKISGMPVQWRTRILVWEPESHFVDIQLKGPYKKWHHTHRFDSSAKGTWMSDKVVYQLPFGRLGDLLMGRKVRRQIEEIFGYRRKMIEEIFGK